jgi:hypothetical protein
VAIPAYPEFAPLALEHKPVIDALFSRIEPRISEFTFTNLFMWRHYYNLSVSRSGSFTVFLARPDGKPPFFLPVWGKGDPCPVLRNCLHHLEHLSGNGHIERVSEDYMARVGQPPPDVEVTPDPNNDDYVYTTKDLITLAGRRYDAKRNHISKFEKQWMWEYRPINDELVHHCQELADKWCIQRNCADSPTLAAEQRAVREFFDNYQALGVRGGVIMLDGKVAAFAAGERLNRDTFVVHLEKADPAIGELYAVINREFNRRECAQFKYVNREQDLGEDNLRKAKQSYRPVMMVKKFKIRLAPRS